MSKDKNSFAIETLITFILITAILTFISQVLNILEKFGVI